MSTSAEIYAFQAEQLVVKDVLPDLALVLKSIEKQGDSAPILLFDAENGRQLDLDLSGTPAQVKKRYGAEKSAALNVEVADQSNVARRGRPKLGVVGREVTLLPRHWEWLEQQRGGASATLRRLIDQARKEVSGQEQVRHSQDAAQRFMTAMAGNLSGYEEAVRALYARDKAGFDKETAGWPADIRQCTRQYAQHAFA